MSSIFFNLSQNIIMYSLKKLVLVILVASTASILFCVGEASTRPFYINYQNVVPTVDLKEFNESILSATVEWPSVERKDHQIWYGYLSLLEIAPNADYLTNIQNAGVPFVGENEEWSSHIVDIRDPRWSEFILERIQFLKDRGFNGVFFDTVETIELLAQLLPGNREEIESSAIEILTKVRQRFPDMKLIVNRGFAILNEIVDVVDGVLVESFAHSYDYKSGTYQVVSESDREWLMGRLKPFINKGKDVYIVDFCRPDMLEEITTASSLVAGYGFKHLITSPDIMGRIHGPVAKNNNYLLCLFGGPSSVELRDYSMDSGTATQFQLAAEWLGFEMDHLNPNEIDIPYTLPTKYRGVIVDSSVKFPVEIQDFVVKWLISLPKQGIKVFFLGSFPQLPAPLTQKLIDGFGFSGSAAIIESRRPPEIQQMHEDFWDFEWRLKPDRSGFQDLYHKSPKNVLLELSRTDTNGKQYRYMPCFTANWGGVLLDPYISKLHPEDYAMLQLNPFKMIKYAFMDREWMPVADVTTRQGLRMFFAHIDGDGLLNFSQVEPGQRSGKVIRDQIIDHYGLPVTASIIESEVIGHSVVYPAKNKSEHVELSKSIFSMDLVEPSSHTYSHPYYWGAKDRTRDTYDTRHPHLTIPYEIDYEREAKASLDYINNHLVPDDKKTNVILWSGNCRLPPEAMEIVARHNLLNMNGGNTTITNRSPYISQISPKSNSWNFTLPQVFAPIQNENVFNNTFDNGLFGGFANVIQTFQMTESPKRLKPLNIYYHFYSADRLDAFYALRRVYDYAAKQLLHPVFASDFIKQVQASHHMQVFWISENHFRAYCPEPVPTIRIPASVGYPDFGKSSGIIGYNDDQGQRYLTTNGQEVVEVVLSADPPDAPFLKYSTLKVQDWERTANSLEFSCQSIRKKYTDEVVLSGFDKNQEIEIQINDIVISPNWTEDGDLLIHAKDGDIVKIIWST